MAQNQVPVSYANVLKRSYQTYKRPGGELGKSGGGGVSGGSLVPRAFQSFSANCIMVDFTGMGLSKEEAFSLITNTYQGIEGVKFLQQGKLVEVSFESQEAVKVGLEKSLHVGEIALPVSRCFSPKQDIIPIAVHGMPIHPKEDTYKEVSEAFNKFGKMQELKFHCYQNTNIRMDSCSVILDRSVKEQAAVDLPRQIDLFSKSCDLFWKEASPYCKYCKNEGHYVQKCPKLEKKKEDEARQGGSKSGQVGTLTGGSSESVHAPPLVSKRGDISVIENQDQMSMMDTGNHYSNEANPPMENDGAEDMEAQLQEGLEEGRIDMSVVSVPRVERGQVAKELGPKRRRLIQVESSSEASDDQSANEFLVHTPTRKGESFSSLVSQLESLKGDIVETGLSDFDEEMEGVGEGESESELILESEEDLLGPDPEFGQVGKKVSHVSRAVISLSGVEIDSEDLPSFLQ